MTSSADDFLNGPLLPFARFPQIGDTVVGIITDEPYVTEQTDINGMTRTYDDGNPMLMLAVHLDTVDGPRLLQVKGSLAPESRSMRAAVAQASRVANTRLQVGGRLAVTYIGNGAPHAPGMHPPKQYRAHYEGPGTFRVERSVR